MSEPWDGGPVKIWGKWWICTDFTANAPTIGLGIPGLREVSVTLVRVPAPRRRWQFWRRVQPSVHPWGVS